MGVSKLKHTAIVCLTVATIAVVGQTVNAEPRPIHRGITGQLHHAERGDQYQTATPATPKKREWTGPIPAYYGPGSECTQANANLIARAMWNMQANNDQVLRMLTIISRESGCDSAAYNDNPATKDRSYGFCQLNALAGHFGPNGTLAGYNPHAFQFDPRHNADACAALWVRCGFGPWIKGDYGCRRP